MKTLTDTQRKALASLNDAKATLIKLNDDNKPYTELLQDLDYMGIACRQDAIFKAIKYMSVANEVMDIDIRDYNNVLTSLADIGLSLITWHEYNVIDELRKQS